MSPGEEISAPVPSYEEIIELLGRGWDQLDDAGRREVNRGMGFDVGKALTKARNARGGEA